MVCTVNDATEDLQRTILDFSNYCALHYHMKMERARKRLRQQGEQYRHLKLVHRHACCHVSTPFTHAHTIVFQFPITAHLTVSCNP